MEITKSLRDLCSRTVGEVVAEDYRRATVFKHYGIDFCCGGDKILKEAAEAKGIACDEIMRALAGAEPAPRDTADPVPAVADPAVTVREPIEMLEHEHDHAGALMREIRALSGGFAAPEAACTTMRMAYAELKAFEADLHRHVHLENNVLFPAATRLEQELARPA